MDSICKKAIDFVIISCTIRFFIVHCDFSSNLLIHLVSIKYRLNFIKSKLLAHITDKYKLDDLTHIMKVVIYNHYVYEYIVNMNMNRFS